MCRVIQYQPSAYQFLLSQNYSGRPSEVSLSRRPAAQQPMYKQSIVCSTHVACFPTAAGRVTELFIKYNQNLLGSLKRPCLFCVTSTLPKECDGQQFLDIGADGKPAWSFWHLDSLAGWMVQEVRACPPRHCKQRGYDGASPLGIIMELRSRKTPLLIHSARRSHLSFYS